MKSYDEKKFAQDPLGQDGGLDRMLWNLHMMRYFQYVDVLEHIFNTGYLFLFFVLIVLNNGDISSKSGNVLEVKR